MLDRQAVQHRTAEVQGLSVFYREAGDPTSPKLLLLGGFPASSHQFRNLIPALADRFHVLSPDYPGFGNTDMPEDFEYTFDRLSEVVEGLLEHTGFHPFGLYHPGLRRTDRQPHRRAPPEWLEWQVIQNSNAYEEGFTAAWDGIRHALWVDRSPETEAPLAPFLQLEGVKLVYTHGHRAPDQISPDNWNMDLHFLERPGARRVQLDLLYDYRTNVALYPQWQSFLRERQPKTLVLWGENDIFFTPEGGRGVPARSPRGGAAHARQRALRGRGLARRDHGAHQALLRQQSQWLPGMTTPNGPRAPDEGALGQRRPSARGLLEGKAGHDGDLQGAGRRPRADPHAQPRRRPSSRSAGPRGPRQGRLRLPVRVLRALAKRATGARLPLGAVRREPDHRGSPRRGRQRR